MTCPPNSCSDAFFGIIRGSRPSHDDTQVFHRFANSNAFDAATDGERILYVWQGYSGSNRRHLYIAQTKVDLQPGAFPRPVVELPVPAASVGNPQVIWTGSDYLIVWEEALSASSPLTGELHTTHSLRGFRVDRYANTIDDEPFVITAHQRDPAGSGPEGDASVSSGPIAARFYGRPFSLLSTPAGPKIVYSRPDADNGWAPRAFSRSIFRQTPVPVRPRGVR